MFKLNPDALPPDCNSRTTHLGIISICYTLPIRLWCVKAEFMLSRQIGGHATMAALNKGLKLDMPHPKNYTPGVRSTHSLRRSCAS